MNWYRKAQVATRSDRYYYRIHPKGDIENVLRNGLSSYSPADGPGAFVDRPDMERWPDQDEMSDPQTHRLYMTTEQWETGTDRFRIRIPAELVDEQLRQCGNFDEDRYIDTGRRCKVILHPNQFDIDLGQGQWVRADHVTPIMVNAWKQYHKPPGFYGNRFEQEQ